MYVLRIEDAVGRGCYAERISGNAWRSHENGGSIFSNVKHPEPSLDHLLAEKWNSIKADCYPPIPYSAARFGFLNPEQYHRWFFTPRSRQILREIDFRLCIYDTAPSVVVTGYSQIVFSKDHSFRAESVPCDTPREELDAIWEDINLPSHYPHNRE